jgi:hypothetical protein
MEFESGYLEDVKINRKEIGFWTRRGYFDSVLVPAVGFGNNGVNDSN